MSATSWLEIDLAQLEQNLAAFRALVNSQVAGNTVLRRQTGPARIAAAVKADAYGLGLVPVAQRLVAGGIDMFAVYSPQQAEDMITVATDKPILVLMRMEGVTRRDPLYRQAVTGRLHLAVHDREQIKALEYAGRMLGIRVPLHLYIDTGMSRGGLSPGDFAGVMKDISESRNVQLAGVFTHLASAESEEGFADEQLATFDQTVQPLLDTMSPDVLIHVANSYATMRSASYHRDLVRLGLGLWGYGPEAIVTGKCLLSASAIKPIVRWMSRVIHVRTVPAGSPVGYGSTHRVTRQSRLGLVPVGYGDGYPLGLSNAASVDLPHHQQGNQHAAAKVLGRVNMDQIVIDLTDVPEAGVTSEVELYSNRADSPCALPKLAKMANSHCYELLCRLSPRIERRYLQR
jgi:alanine racemase